MPVTDHPVHPSTRIGANHRYGCYNRRPFKAGYMAPDGYALGSHRDTREVQLTYVPHTMSMECHHPAGDPLCGDCKWQAIRQPSPA